MMKAPSLVLLLMLAACGRGESDNRSATKPAEPGSPAAASGESPASAAQPSLAGLYEGGAGAQRNQLCMVEKGGRTQFGLVVWGSDLHSCSGAGDAVREGERLSLTMTGDETCRIDAAIRDGMVTFPATLPTGCAYYCGARARLSGARFAGPATMRRRRRI